MQREMNSDNIFFIEVPPFNIINILQYLIECKTNLYSSCVFYSVIYSAGCSSLTLPPSPNNPSSRIS